MYKYDNILDSDIELRSEDYHYILGKTPGWISRWGISLILLFFFLLLVFLNFFKYPDTISSPFTLTGTTPPARVKAKFSGLLSELYVSDNQEVIKGDYLAIIENSAQTEDVKYIKTYIDDFLHRDSVNLILPTKYLQLGDMQITYLSFYQALYNYMQFKANKYHEKKINILKERISRNMNKYNDLLKQQIVINEQYNLKNKQFQRDSILSRKGIIAKEELENTNIGYLDARLGLLTVNTNTDDIQISMTQMTESLVETENDYIEKDNYYKIQIRNYALQLYTEIESWEINFVLKSPINGKISFNSYWSENQNIIAGEDVFNIMPLNSGLLVAKVFIPMARSGKVKKGQKVNLHFDNFPDNEYGILKGIVNNVSLLPSISDNIT